MVMGLSPNGMEDTYGLVSLYMDLEGFLLAGSKRLQNTSMMVPARVPSEYPACECTRVACECASGLCESASGTGE